MGKGRTGHAEFREKGSEKTLKRYVRVHLMKERQVNGAIKIIKKHSK